MRVSQFGRFVRYFGVSVCFVVLSAGVVGCGSMPSSGPAGQSVSRSPEPVVGAVVGRFEVPGRRGTLLVTRDQHPRGGSQVHLYVEPARTELTTGSGRPLLPFVATDTAATVHATSRCVGRGGLEVSTALLGRPRRAAPTWDIRRAWYRVGEHGAVLTRQRTVVTNVSPLALARDHRTLASDRLLVGCPRLPR